MKRPILLVLQAPPLPLDQGYRHAAYNDVIQLSRIHDLHILICNGKDLIYDFDYNSYEINRRGLSSIPGVESVSFIDIDVDWKKSLRERFAYQVSSFIRQGCIMKDIESEKLTTKIIELCWLHHIRDIHLGITVNLFLDTFSNLNKSGKFRISFTAHDIDADKTLVRMRENFSKKSFIKVITNWLVYWILLWKEIHILKQSQFVVTMAHKDFERQTRRKVNVFFIPPYLHSVNTNHSIKQLPQQPTLTVLGHLSFSAAGNGAEMFVEKVAAKVKEKVPHSVIKIIGKELRQDLISRCKELGILYQEYIEDAEELWKSTTVLASPLLVSKGIRIRILEAAYRGIPVVCTEHSATGFYNPDEFLRRTNDFDSFAENCIELMTNAKSYQQEQERIQEYFNKNLKEEIIRRRWEWVWTEVIPDITINSYQDEDKKIITQPAN
ncbi:MAG: glycosyltransferase family 4 protein [Ignavibacteriales bacterium]